MVAIVTGGSRGLGEHIARGLKEDGHKVAIVHKGVSEKLYESEWVDLEFSGCDVSNEHMVQAIVNKAIATFGQVDILVNNAAIHSAALANTTRLADWQDLINVNLTGAFLMTKYTLPHMQARRYGRIVNIGSFGGHTGAAGAAAYNASKAGLLGLTKTVANENARYGITCNLIAPGCIDVGIFSRFSDEIKEKLLKLTPMRRPATPDEVAWPVRWLCSPEASYITGQSLAVDGGIS